MDKRILFTLAAFAMGASFASATDWVDVEFNAADVAAGEIWTNVAARATGEWDMKAGDASAVVATNGTYALKLETAGNLLSYIAANGAALGATVVTDARITFVALEGTNDLGLIGASSSGGLALVINTNNNDTLTYVGYTANGWVELSNAGHTPEDGETVVVRSVVDYARGTIEYSIVGDSVLPLADSAGNSTFQIGSASNHATGYALKGSGFVYSIRGTVSDVSEIVIVPPTTLTLSISNVANPAETNTANRALSAIDEPIKSAILAMLDNEAVTQFNETGVEEAGVAYIKLVLSNVCYTNSTEEAGAIAAAGFEVVPVSATTGEDMSHTNLSKQVTFRMPVPADTDATWAALFHGETPIGNGVVRVDETSHKKYLQVASAEFSPYSYELNNGAMPTAATIDICAYEGADGVIVEFETTDEAGEEGATIDVYKKVGGEPILIGSVPAVGSGSNLYKIKVTGLEVGGTYSIAINDEEGNWHTVDAVTVTKFATEMIRMTPDGIELKWASIPGRIYKVKYATSLLGPWNDVASVPGADNADSTTYFVWSKNLGESASRFFKVVMTDGE